ncbi:FMN-dependent alpha-hydroxy acid dehydrogenase [Dehalobacter sp. UNSWDHB]|uniref:alpha-hydroxy acid oxidase n=1 Tax=Dehalobacter TaxID=56112 RepID=UPI00028A7FC2|nr:MULTISPECIES: alpha-hydroxy acid oxidase [unclassified Dehalobacter]AFV02266.1 FMN-dependent alpha-hydroxy acid dehydrogenase [Dehalobacter sp. DCA]AFV05309.1 FMN-dependent alpha-hydroxy acid dehydrogenase [Dehalobacter sp. CF]EQB22100.1 FMN-dependent alpha-hydroxy acid dehydrogenase [Dehalobacter sp. UNSWDHB]
MNDGEKKLQEKGMSSRYTAAPGNSSRITRDYIDSLLIEMRVIDSIESSSKMGLFGESFATPVMVAALSGLDNIRPNGMVEVAKGAAAGAVMWSGIGNEQELKAIIETGAKTVKIIKPYSDKDLIFEKIFQAEKYGALAVGMDIDFVFGSKKNKGYAQSYPVSPKTQDDIKSYVKATKLPFVLKGVLSEQDAKKALEVGAAAIVVSHHSGSVLDYAVPPLMILPRIAKIIDRRIPIFVDCSISTGTDAFKALALGAKAVSVGRAVMTGLASDGADGVRKVIEGITEELQMIMNVTGTADCDNIDPDIIWR